MWSKGPWNKLLQFILGGKSFLVSVKHLWLVCQNKYIKQTKQKKSKTKENNNRAPPLIQIQISVVDEERINYFHTINV